MPPSVKLSAIVLTFNEEAKVANCLESLTGIADEIVVVDSFSTDGTEAVCRRYNVRFVQHAYHGYSVQQNYALTVATYDHVLVLDADEWLSDELKASILAVKENWDTDGGYMVNRLNNFYGRWLRRGGDYPDAKVRLWDRRVAQWGGEDPHGLVAIDKSKVKKLRGDLLHCSYAHIGEHIAQLNYYSQQSAKAKYKGGKRANFFFNLFISPAFRFVVNYVVRGGFREGFHGFVYCSLASYLTLLKYIRLYDYKVNGLPPEKEIKPISKVALGTQLEGVRS